MNKHTYLKFYAMSTSEVAKALGTSKRSVERVEKAALRKIAAELKKRGIDATYQP